MGERKEETVKVEQEGHGSDVKATVTKDGQTGKASGKNVEDTVSEAADKAKEQSKSAGER